jgi:hypothetical protein
VIFRGLTVYGYYDGPMLFTAQEVRDDQPPSVYLFRWTKDDLDGLRIYKADGYDITIKENDIDWTKVNW